MNNYVLQQFQIAFGRWAYSVGIEMSRMTSLQPPAPI